MECFALVSVTLDKLHRGSGVLPQSLAEHATHSSRCAGRIAGPGWPASNPRGAQGRRKSLDLVKGDNLLTKKPLQYLQCSSFEEPVKAGDNLEFKSGNDTAGVFTVYDIPKHDAIFVLVAHKRAALASKSGYELDFLSHVFAPTDTAQLAVIDAYNGAESNMSISTVGGNESRSEPLSFGTATGINAGTYDVILDANGRPQSLSFTADKKECYVLVRTGWKAARQNLTYPEQLVIYPDARGSAASFGVFGVLAMLLSHPGLSVVIMFSWLTGGGGISVTPNYDSSIEPGKKGMLTEPIEDMTTEKFKVARLSI
eukprot:s3904_g2.t1